MSVFFSIVLSESSLRHRWPLMFPEGSYPHAFAFDIFMPPFLEYPELIVRINGSRGGSPSVDTVQQTTGGDK